MDRKLERSERVRRAIALYKEISEEEEDYFLREVKESKDFLFICEDKSVLLTFGYERALITQAFIDTIKAYAKKHKLKLDSWGLEINYRELQLFIK